MSRLWVVPVISGGVNPYWVCPQVGDRGIPNKAGQPRITKKGPWTKSCHGRPTKPVTAKIAQESLEAVPEQTVNHQKRRRTGTRERKPLRMRLATLTMLNMQQW